MVKQEKASRRIISYAFSQKRSYSAPTDGSIPPAKAKYVPTSGTYPKGFLAGSAHAGVKPSNTRFDDSALVTSEVDCEAAAVFTTNTFKAAPVQISKEVLRHGGIRSVVVNSGCANAVTGKRGSEDARAMAMKTEESLGVPPKEHLQTSVMSTGVIGQRLPIEKITSKIPALQQSLGNSHDHWLRTARAICTTDTFPKLSSRTFTLPSQPGTTYSIAGMTKGAGMIHPNMATLLGIVCTDAKVESASLRWILKRTAKTSFNSISIDGDTSTNDTVAMFANGAAAPEGSNAIQKANTRPDSKQESEDFRAFYDVVKTFMADLAKSVVRDGEGATKFVTINVKGAKTDESAKNIAESISRSPLVKTALYGKDANWGRILCAVGYSPAKSIVRPQRTSVSFIPADGSEELKLSVRGEPQEVDEVRAKEILEMEDSEILVRLDDGYNGPNLHGGAATMWTCDFSHEYVTINGDYRT